MLKNITKNNIKTIHIVQNTAHFVPDTNVGHKKMPAAKAASKISIANMEFQSHGRHRPFRRHKKSLSIV